MTRLPTDPRSGNYVNSGALDYLYLAVDQAGTTTNNPQRYELSVAFEGTTGTAGIPNPASDSGDDNFRHEVGTNNLSPNILTTRTALIGTLSATNRCVDASNAPNTCSGTMRTVIRGGN